MPTSHPIALSIAGSDPSGGAGLQADLKVFADHDVYGAAVVTALTVQNTRGVRAVHPVAPELVGDQLAAVLDDLPVAAVKIGMLGDPAVLRAVVSALARVPAVPVVLDPVLRATSGPALLPRQALEALVHELMPRCAIVTPNLPELATLEGYQPDLRAQCRRDGVALLVKGGHGEGHELFDRLLLPDGRSLLHRHPRIVTRNLHGTGCALSSAIAAQLALGKGLAESVHAAIAYLQGRIVAGVEWRIGGGAGPLPLGLRHGGAGGEPEAG
jgi:hydroxymethylpyrimidine/phosphomethylpyrimidine kinase